MSTARSIPRREPPPFRVVTVAGKEAVSSRMIRVFVTGDALDGFSIDAPAASVRLLLPRGDHLEIPTWRGNEFLLVDDTRPTIRTLTPRRFDDDRRVLDLDIALHQEGVLTPWAQGCRPGDQAAVSGPGRGYEIDPTAGRFVLLGDESAIPAICQLLEWLPDVPISTHIGIASEDAVVDLHRDVDERWSVVRSVDALGDQLVDSIADLVIDEGTRVWAAGEAAAMHRLRGHLFDERGVQRSAASVRGYWKAR